MEASKGLIYSDVNDCLLVSGDRSRRPDADLLMKVGLSSEDKARLQQGLQIFGRLPYPDSLEQFLASSRIDPLKYHPRNMGLEDLWEYRSIVKASSLVGDESLDYKLQLPQVQEYAKTRIDPFVANHELIQALENAAIAGFEIELLSNLSRLSRGLLLEGILKELAPSLGQKSGIMAVMRPHKLRSSAVLKVATVAFQSLQEPDIPGIFVIENDSVIIQGLAELGICNGFLVPLTEEQLKHQPALQQQAFQEIFANGNSSKVIIMEEGESMAAGLNRMLSL